MKSQRFLDATGTLLQAAGGTRTLGVSTIGVRPERDLDRSEDRATRTPAVKRQTVEKGTEGTVVVPGIGVASSVACLRSFGKRRIPTILVSEGEQCPARSSKYCDEFVRAPDPTEDCSDYAEFLLALSERPDVLTIVPLREEDVYVLSKYRQEFEAHVSTPWPDFETLRRVQDRVELFETAEDAGVAVPKTETLDEWNAWDREVVIKPRYTVATDEYLGDAARTTDSVGSTIYVDPDDALCRGKILAECGHVPIVQEYIPSPDEYGFFALYDRGEAVATFQHRQRRGQAYCGGPSAFRESVRIPELDAAGRRLLDELDWHGLAMVEFLRDEESGEFKLMEVNPRFWSSLPFTIQAGVDFPYLYWLQAQGRTIEAEIDYDVGTAGHHVCGELGYLYTILTEEYPLVERPSLHRAALEVTASLLQHRRFDYFDLEDPRPFVRDLLQFVTGR